ncbi:unnamed protein product [Spodoptera littoralis]|uniref:Uncharacterized protein n=1 Tax=Spodoptera littoralis TaxID=7109 RepID=A0A9P0IBN0_SPOLI|nr:unnamed protein product [Spodoptera littoralis]CAH1642941.1 unnamed protein product [Spodoptera littoralis]
MDPTDSTMEVDEIKTEKSENKLPFSIENLLADKFERQCFNEFSDNANASTSGVTSDLKSNYVSDVPENIDSDDDDRVSSDSSENVDVESSTVGDAQEFLDMKSTDYSQSDKDMVPKPSNKMEAKIHKRHRTSCAAVLQQPWNRQPSTNVCRRPSLDLQLPKQSPPDTTTAMDKIS